MDETKSQKEKIIDYIQGMTEERMYEIFHCQDEKNSVFDCPYWVRRAKRCYNPQVCHKIPYEQPFEKKEREAARKERERAEQGSLF